MLSKRSLVAQARRMRERAVPRTRTPFAARPWASMLYHRQREPSRISAGRAAATRRRPVLTHCQVLGADLIERMGRLGVIANIQPSFV